MIYALGTRTLKGYDTTVITAAEYDFAKASKKNLIEALQIEERYDIVLVNYKEFEDELVTLAVSHSIHADFSSELLSDERRAINRRLINLLSTSRMYLDQLAHSISKIFGKCSSEPNTVKKFINEQYDRNLSYRLMEQLRNFMQHRGLALGGLSIELKKTELQPSGQIAFTITPQIVKQDFVDDPKVKAQIRKDTNTLPDLIDVKPHVRHYIELIGSINEEVRKILDGPSKGWELALCKLIEAYCRERSLDCLKPPRGLSLLTFSEVDPLKCVESDDFFMEFVEHRKVLQDRNKNIRGLHVRFATGQESEKIVQR
jgi:hypothetical protein